MLSSDCKCLARLVGEARQGGLDLSNGALIQRGLLLYLKLQGFLANPYLASYQVQYGFKEELIPADRVELKEAPPEECHHVDLVGPHRPGLERACLSDQIT